MNPGSPISLSVVVPVFNEEENLSELIRRSLAVLDELANPSELILVDDGSSDESALLIEKAVGERPGQIRGLIFNRNYGQHMAVMAGLEASRGEVIVTLDADLQNPPEEIPRLLAAAAEGYDVVGTVRRNRRDSFFRRLASRLVNRITARATGVKMTDYGCMLRAYNRTVVDAVLQCQERSTFIPVLGNSFARNTTEIEVAHSERGAGASKYGLLSLINLQFDLLVNTTNYPLRVLSVLGVIICSLGVGFGFFLILMRLILGAAWAAQGVFTLFAVLFIFVGLQFVGMGLVGEYIGRIYKDVRARPRYCISRRIGQAKLPRRRSSNSTQPSERDIRASRSRKPERWYASDAG